MPIARIFIFFKVLKSSTLNWSSRENQISNQPIQGFSKETLPKQNKTNPYHSYDFTMEKAGTNPQQLYPFLMQAGHGKKQMNSWQSDKDPYWVTFVIQQGGNNHFTLHKHMTC
jgi:hypothetical protein